MDKQNLQILIEKLKLAEEVYKRAADKIHSDKMSEDLVKMSNAHMNLKDSLVKEIDLPLKDVSIGLKDQIKVSIEKLGMEVDDILLRLNQKEVLSYCIKREKEIIDAYKTLVNNKSLSEKEQNRFKALSLESEKRVNGFEKIKEEYYNNPIAE